MGILPTKAFSFGLEFYLNIGINDLSEGGNPHRPAYPNDCLLSNLFQNLRWKEEQPIAA